MMRDLYLLGQTSLTVSALLMLRAFQPVLPPDLVIDWALRLRARLRKYG